MLGRVKSKRLWLKVVFVFVVLLLAAMAIRAALWMPKVSFSPLIPDEPLEFPLHVDIFPDDASRFVVVEKTGKIKWFKRDSLKAGGVMLNIADRVDLNHWEDGLLSFAFDPNFENNGYFYIHYTMASPTRVRLSRFKMNAGFMADSASEHVILELEKEGTGHNGGMIQFDREGYLYLSLGDGNQTVSEAVKQTTKTLFGSILRIDISQSSIEQPYKIPKDNPFVGEDDSRAEIWAHGFRNPWRFSIDPVSQEIYLGDVGNLDYEEINKVEKGGYYGWPVMEGTFCSPPDEPQNCDKTQSIPPLAEVSHETLRAIVGGYIYRGNDIPWLKGQYVFSDFIRGVYSVDFNKKTSGDGVIREITTLSYKSPVLNGPNKGEAMHIVSFVSDANGELYLADLRGGVYKLEEVNFPTMAENFFHHMFTF